MYVSADTQRYGITILPVDIERSEAKCTIEHGCLRLGLQHVKGVKDKATTRILAEREKHPFQSLEDFCQRTQLPQQLIERLIQAGAMDMWGIPKRSLFWELGRVHYQVDELAWAYRHKRRLWLYIAPI